MEDIYIIGTSYYDDWSIKGFTTDKDYAEKYAAFKNNKNPNTHYYYSKLEKIEIDNIIKNIKLKYYGYVTYDFNKGIKKENTRINSYYSDNKQDEEKVRDLAKKVMNITDVTVLADIILSEAKKIMLNMKSLINFSRLCVMTFLDFM